MQSSFIDSEKAFLIFGAASYHKQVFFNSLKQVFFFFNFK